MAAVVVLTLALVFGAADQYLGSVSVHFHLDQPWMAQVSLLSAPWLLLPFLVGYSRINRKDAVWLGLASTYAALVGYAVMTLSPAEHAHLSLGTLHAFGRSEAPVVIGGIVTGPLFGWFGRSWRVRRSWVGATLTATAFSLEPLARAIDRSPISSTGVIAAEVIVGVLMTAYIAARIRVTECGHVDPIRHGFPCRVLRWK